VEFLKTLADGQVWARLEPFVTPIEHLHVSEAGTASLIRFHANDYGEFAFGYTVPITHVHRVLSERVESLEVNVQSSKQVSAVEAESGRLIFSDGQSLEAPLILACDGGNSFIRTFLGLKTDRHDYHQSALVTSLTLRDSHGNWAFERFLPEGVLAVLPLASTGKTHTVGVVWVQSQEKTEAAMALADTSLLAMLQEAFGQRLGRFLQIGPRHTYPLEKIIAKTTFAGRVLLMGNSAHQLNPVGAQGWNLALRDIATLLTLLDQSKKFPMDSIETLFNTYQKARSEDHAKIEQLTHGMAMWYGSDDLFSVIGRRSVMRALRYSLRLREHFVSTFMGKQAYFAIQEIADGR
jgi:2-octaprenyl-6-methoxyphenol hydroxylase